MIFIWLYLISKNNNLDFKTTCVKMEYSYQMIAQIDASSEIQTQTILKNNVSE